MNSFCPNCDKFSEIRVITEKETYAVRGDDISVEAQVAYCNACNKKIFNEKLDGENLAMAFNAYRLKHNLLSVDDIVAIRRKYGLSQRALSRLLDWGEVTINRYENGSLPDPAHNDVLEFIGEVGNMRKIFEKKGHLLNGRDKKQLRRKLEELSKYVITPDVNQFVEDKILSEHREGEYSGYISFDLAKIQDAILYIAKKCDGVFKTKLNKLLWYVDFLFFARHTRSVTGAMYKKMQYGPVPDYYEMILAGLVENGVLCEQEVTTKDISGSKYYSVGMVDSSNFVEEEIQVLDYVVDYFKDFTCEQIMERSHQEVAYERVGDKQPISYEFAGQLSLLAV